MHEGSADSGHYYAFIYERKTKKWYRFNDFKVTEVLETTVFEESYGDPSSASKSCAYALIYINKEISNKLD